MKNFLSLCFIICCGFLLFSGCQKEISNETGSGVGTAHGTLKDTSGNCLPDSVHGTFYNGITPGSDTCFVELQVNVTETGSYTISTDLQNGFQFVDSGFFNATGINIIRLKPIGTPIIPIATVFSVGFDSSVCSFFVDVKDSTGTGLGHTDATGTLKDSLGNCLPDSVHGTYYNGITPGSDTCFVEIQVNVTQLGPYNISTDIQNGFQFADAGVFSVAGINTVALKPVGTPILPIATNFSVSFDTSVCSFSVDVKDSTGSGLGGGGGSGGDTTAANTWKFTDSTNGLSYTGVFQDPGGIFNLDSWGWELTLLGSNNLVTADTSFFLSVQMPSNTIEVGSYYTNVAPSTGCALGDQTGSVLYYEADATTSQVIKVNITSSDNNLRVVKGNFSGTSLHNGNTVYITHGAFNARLP